MSERLSDAVIQRYAEGTFVEERAVTHVVEGGAFVELESGLEALVLRSDMAWVSPPADARGVYQPGDRISAIVSHVDLEKGRIRLSIKNAHPNPFWDDFVRLFPVGAVILGPVTNLVDHGLFVGLPGGLCGLLHETDMDDSPVLGIHVRHARTGDIIVARVLDLDAARERVCLGTAQVRRHADWTPQRTGWAGFDGRHLVSRQWWRTFALDDAGTAHWWDSEAMVWRRIGLPRATDILSDHHAVAADLRRAVRVIRLYEHTAVKGERLAARSAMHRLAMHIRERLSDDSDEGWPEHSMKPEAWLYQTVTRDARFHMRSENPPAFRRDLLFRLAKLIEA